MTPGLPKAVVKIVAERNERIADVPTNLYIAFFLLIAASLPVIVVGYSSNLLNLLGITHYELIFSYTIVVSAYHIRRCTIFQTGTLQNLICRYRRHHLLERRAHLSCPFLVT
jgi:O-antigen/teichoic acid export membrane protein